MKIENYALYLRKSRADMEAEKLGEGETLARHKKILTELAARKGLHVGKIYHEIVSGETIAARPQIQQMIQDCYNGLYRGNYHRRGYEAFTRQSGRCTGDS